MPQIRFARLPVMFQELGDQMLKYRHTHVYIYIYIYIYIYGYEN